MKIKAKKNLRILRTKKGFSVESLAKAAGIAYATACHMENGRFVYPQTVKKICETLNCGFDDIFEIQEAVK